MSYSRTAWKLLTALVVTAVVGTTMMASAGAEPGGIVISEMNYHAISDLDGDDFLELTNTSASAIDVSGWSFSAGITAILPAGSVIPGGGRYVAAKDAVRFQTTYGFAPNAVYGGNLANSGETVTLVDGALAVIDTVTYADLAPWPPSADGEGPSLELRGLLTDNTVAENWGPSSVIGGTPRAANSIDGTAPLPKVTQVVATPTQPDPGQAVTVSAKLPVGSTATLKYKVMYAPDISVPFLDDAASPGGANNGVFAATIPGQSAGLLVRYRVEATSASVAFSSPPAGDGMNYHGVVVRNPAVTSNIPVLEWFMADSVYNDILANHRLDDTQGEAVIAYNGVVYDNARMNVRGQTSRSKDPVNWKVEMPSGHPIVFGAPFPRPMDEWALQRDADPLADLAWSTVKEAGAQSLEITAVRSQRNGQFWSVGRVMELEDGTWRDGHGVDDWAIYKGDDGGLLTRSTPAQLQATANLDKKTREDEDFTDVWQLTQAVAGGPSTAQKAWIDANVDVPALVNYIALNALIRHTDSGWKNWYVSRDTAGTGRWQLWHWDLNWTFTPPEDDGDGVYLTPSPNNRLVAAMLSYPEFSEMYFRRLRTLADQFLVAGGYESKWNTIVQPYSSDWAAAASKWSFRSESSAWTKFLQGLADRRNLMVDYSGAGKPIPPSQSATPTAVINEIQYRPAGGDLREFVELTNPTVESIDLSGWTIDSIGLTIPVGTVLRPNAQVVFAADDVAFRATYGSDRFIGGEFSGSLSETGQTLTLRQGPRVVDEVTYSNTSPWPSAADGTGPSLELGDPVADNTDGATWYATSTGGGTPGRPNQTPVGPDTTNPAAPSGLTASLATDTQASLAWSAASDDRGVTGYRVTRNGVVVAPFVATLGYQNTGLAEGTTYTYTVQSLDGAGNLSGPSSPAVVTTPTTTAPPLYTDTFSTGSTWGSAWTTTTSSGTVDVQAGVGRLAVNDTASAYARAQLTGVAARADADVTFSYRWNANTPSTYFNVYLRGSGGWQNSYRPRTGYGLEMSPNSGNITIKKNVNSTVTTLGSAGGANSTTTQKQWLRLRVVGSTIQFKTWLDGSAEPSAWRATVTDTSITAPGQFFLSDVRGGNNVGAKNVSIDDVTLRSDGPVGPGPDLTPPSAPTSLAASNIGTDRATLTWAPSTDNVGVVGYTLYRDGDVIASPTTTTFVDTGLVPDTEYIYTVKARDAAGNTSLSSIGVWVLTPPPPPPDTLAPTVPAGLAASNVATDRATVTWSASTDNVGVTGYDLLRDGIVIAAPTSTSFADSGLAAGTTYAYTVRAKDAAGNVSGLSSPLSVTTTTTPPSLFSDTFDGTNGAAWGSAWTSSVASGGTVNLQSGAGRLAFTDVVGAYARAQLTGLAARVDSDVTMSYRWNPTGANTYFNVWSRGSGGWQNGYRPMTGYGVEMTSNSTSVSLKRNVNGTSTTLATVTNGQVLTTQKQWIRLRTVGSTVQFKTWVDGTAEPATWRTTVTDTQVTAPGQLYLTNIRSSSNVGPKAVDVDDVTVKAG